MEWKAKFCFQLTGIKALGSQAKHYSEVSQSFLITEILAPAAPDRLVQLLCFRLLSLPGPLNHSPQQPPKRQPLPNFLLSQESQMPGIWCKTEVVGTEGKWAINPAPLDCFQVDGRVQCCHILWVLNKRQKSRWMCKIPQFLKPRVTTICDTSENLYMKWMILQK